MLKWLILGSLIYFIYKSAGPLLGLFKMNQQAKMNKKRSDIRSKVNRMDIQDAEYEEESNE